MSARNVAMKLVGMSALLFPVLAVLFLLSALVFSCSWASRVRDAEEAPLARLGSVTMVERSETQFIALRGVTWSCERGVPFANRLLVPGTAEEGGRLVFAELPGRIERADCPSWLREPVGTLGEIPDGASDALRAKGNDVITNAGGWPLYYAVLDMGELRAEPERLRHTIRLSAFVLLVGWFMRRWLRRGLQALFATSPASLDGLGRVVLPAVNGPQEVEARVLLHAIDDRIVACGGRPELLDELVHVCLAQGFNDSAARVAEALVAIRPDAERAWALAADCARARADPWEGARIVDRWEKKLGRSAHTVESAALNAMVDEKPREAFDLAREALSLDPNDVGVIGTFLRAGSLAAEEDRARAEVSTLFERTGAWGLCVALLRIARSEGEHERWSRALAERLEASPEIAAALFVALRDTGPFDDVRAIIGERYAPELHGVPIGIALVQDFVARGLVGEATNLARRVGEHADASERDAMKAILAMDAR